MLFRWHALGELTVHACMRGTQVRIAFPLGVPSDAWLMSDRGQAEPSMVVDLTLWLKGWKCLEIASRRAGQLARLLGECCGASHPTVKP
jgi:hypothetical protein